MIRAAAIAWLAFLLVGCTTPKERTESAAGGFSALVLPVPGRAMQASSWDRTGGNFDTRAVEPGQTITILDHAGGPGIVERFWCTIAPRANPEIHRQAILRMYWDGSDAPAVECPVGDFFGVGFGMQKDFISAPLNQTSGGYNCYWPMPFRRSARWTLTNLSNRRIDAFYFNIDYRVLPAGSLPDDLRYFHAQWRRQNPTDPGTNYVILDTDGAGHYVGCSMSMQAIAPTGLSFLEGDEQVFIDGESAPSIVGTGTEDYFSSGWYYDRGEYSAPYHGVIIKDERLSRICTYRWHIPDPKPFIKSVRVEIEHGHANENSADYSSTAFFYATGVTKRPPPLLPADRLLASQPPQPRRYPGVLEAEALPNVTVTAGAFERQAMHAFTGGWSDGSQLWWRPDAAGETMAFDVAAPRSGEFQIVAFLTRAPDYGRVRFTIGGVPLPQEVDLYAPRVEPTGRVVLGRARLQVGLNRMSVEVTGRSERSTGYLVGIDAIALEP